MRSKNGSSGGAPPWAGGTGDRWDEVGRREVVWRTEIGVEKAGKRTEPIFRIVGHRPKDQRFGVGVEIEPVLSRL